MSVQIENSFCFFLLHFLDIPERSCSPFARSPSADTQSDFRLDSTQSSSVSWRSPMAIFLFCYFPAADTLSTRGALSQQLEVPPKSCYVTDQSYYC